MSEVKRYELVEMGKTYHKAAEMLLAEDGLWVDYEDYAELKAQCDALAADREKFAVQCAAAKIAVQYAQAAGFECTLNTPAVDAYLNSVRAEGVKILADRMQQTIDNAKLNSDEIGALAGAIFTGAAIAAQLRAGEPS